MQSPNRPSLSAQELRGAGFYGSLPRSLKDPALVRSKIEDPDVQRERAEMTRNKSPAQLAEFNSLSDIPIPRFSKDHARNQADNR